MNTQSLILVVYALLSFAPASSSSDVDRLKAWQSIEVGGLGNVTVRLRVKRQATLADEEWMAIEFENRGDKEFELDSVSYRIESIRLDLKTGKRISSGGLALGQAYALFPHAWETTPASQTVVKPGMYRMIDHPSLYSSALLGLPKPDGWLVKAELFMGVPDLDIDSGEGHRFEFQWLYPDEVDFDRMRVRLRRLLANPRNYVQHAYILHALLEIPEVARATSAGELLAAMTSTKDVFSGRGYVVSHLDENYAEDALVVGHFYGRLVTGDQLILDDMILAPRIWNMAFLQPLIERFEKDPRSPGKVFQILVQHGTPQKYDPKLAERLSIALLHHGCLKELKRGIRVVGNLKAMGSTHDRKVIPRLMPYLSDATETLNPHFLAVTFGRLPPLRVKDNALEAIVTILDGDLNKAYQLAGYQTPTAIVGPATYHDELTARMEAVTAVRDKMIVTLKRRLAKLMIIPEK